MVVLLFYYFRFFRNDFASGIHAGIRIRQFQAKTKAASPSGHAFPKAG
jgi:hypothetical protein